MKTVSPALAQHLAGEVTTLATCWKITRRDGVVLGFTDHVRDLEVDGVTYRAASGYTRTAIRSTADLAVDNLDVESVFSDEGITEEDLRTGRYDFAEVRMFLVNYADLGQGILKLRRGWLGEIAIRDGMYIAELRGMTQKLQMTMGEVYAPDCAADLGDIRCGVDLVALEEIGAVSAVPRSRRGRLSWRPGQNREYRSRRARRHDARHAEGFTKVPRPIPRLTFLASFSGIDIIPRVSPVRY